MHASAVVVGVEKQIEHFSFLLFNKLEWKVRLQSLKYIVPFGTIHSDRCVHKYLSQLSDSVYAAVPWCCRGDRSVILSTRIQQIAVSRWCTVMQNGRV